MPTDVKGTPPCEEFPITHKLLQHVYGKHSPIYPRAKEKVTYTASARGIEAEGVKITSLQIRVQEYKVEAEAASSLTFTPTEDHSHTATIDPPAMEASTNLEVHALPEDTWVRYTVVAELEDGQKLTDAGIRHAANLSESTIRALKGAIPIYRRGRHVDKMDILLVPDTDYGTDEDQYLSDAEDYVHNGYFTDPPYRFKRFRRYMNVYLNTLKPEHMADFEGGFTRNDKPDNFDGDDSNLPDLTWPDAAVVLHVTSFQDFSNTGLLEGNFSSADNEDVFVHETGHSLIGARDEYDADISALAPDLVDHRNVFPSESACQAELGSHADFAQDHCTTSGTYEGEPKWQWCSHYLGGILPGVGCVMGSQTSSTPFGPEERCRIVWIIDELLGDPEGSVYGPIWVRGCAGYPCGPALTRRLLANKRSNQMPEEDHIKKDDELGEHQLQRDDVSGRTMTVGLQVTETRITPIRAVLRKGPASNNGTDIVYAKKPTAAPVRIELFRGKKRLRVFAFSDPRIFEHVKFKQFPKDLTSSIRIDYLQKDLPDGAKIIDAKGNVLFDGTIQVSVK